MSMKIEDIGSAPRYYFTVDYIFPGARTVDAFPKNDFDTGFHEQEFYEINIITAGKGYHALDSQLVEAEVGDVFIVPPYRRHAFVGGKGFNCHHFLLSPHFLQNNLARLSSLPNFSAMFEIGPIMSLHDGNFIRFKLNERTLADVIGALDIITYGSSTDAARSIINESAAIIAIAILCDAYRNVEYSSAEDSLFARSISAIKERYSEKLTIEELSAIAGLSRTAYIEKFKRITGLSPRQYIIAERIKVAKHLLVTTERSITKIADEVGFYDTSHFIKCFIASEGVSPLEYREKTTAQPQ